MMDYVLLIIVFVLLGALVLSSVLVYKMSVRAVESAQQSHERSNDYNRDLLDRLMATDWITYKAYEAKDPGTAYVPPEPAEEVPVARHRMRGFGSSLGLAPELQEEVTDEDR